MTGCSPPSIALAGAVALFESLPVVHDPWFYAVAVPAVLVTGLAKSGFASGFGSLATPMMGMMLTVPQAAAIMLPLLMTMDATGLHQMWHDRDRALVRRLIPFGLLGTVVGTLLGSSACCRPRPWRGWSAR